MGNDLTLSEFPHFRIQQVFSVDFLFKAGSLRRSFCQMVSNMHVQYIFISFSNIGLLLANAGEALTLLYSPGSFSEISELSEIRCPFVASGDDQDHHPSSF